MDNSSPTVLPQRRHYIHFCRIELLGANWLGSDEELGFFFQIQRPAQAEWFGQERTQELSRLLCDQLRATGEGKPTAREKKKMITIKWMWTI